MSGLRWAWDWWRARKRQRERMLYEVWDGRRFRRIDPWATYRTLLGAPNFSLQEQLPAALQGEEPELSKAREAICTAFGVAPFDAASSSGLTDEELFRLLSDFLDYCDGLEKKTLGFATVSPPSEPRASTGRDFLDRATS